MRKLSHIELTLFREVKYFVWRFLQSHKKFRIDDFVKFNFQFLRNQTQISLRSRYKVNDVIVIDGNMYCSIGTTSGLFICVVEHRNRGTKTFLYK